MATLTSVIGLAWITLGINITQLTRNDAWIIFGALLTLTGGIRLGMRLNEKTK
jgi:hypothetical protein